MQPKYVTSVSKYNDTPENNDKPNNAVKKDGELEEKENAVTEIQDGHYFIRLLENEIFKFEEQICDFEEDLASSSPTEANANALTIPEDIRDSILAAVGKVRLFLIRINTLFYNY